MEEATSWKSGLTINCWPLKKPLNTKAQLKQHKRDARKAITLQEQNAYQEKIAALERQQRQQRREIFNTEDEIIDKRDELIDSLQVGLKEATETNCSSPCVGR